MINPEFEASNQSNEVKGILSILRRINDVRNQLSHPTAQARKGIVNEQLLEKVSGLALELRNLNHNLVVEGSAGHQSMLSQAVVPGQNFAKS